MNIHQNARLTPKGRALLVRCILAGETPRVAAATRGVSERTARRWLARYRGEGEAGLYDRSSRPRHSPRRTPQAVVDRVLALRRQRWTGRRIAQTLRLSPATVSRLLGRAGLNRLRDLEPAPPVRRYEHHRPGDLLHLDIKKLGRFQHAGHRVTGDKTRRSRAAGWSSSTSPSTTIPASPSPRSCPMSAAFPLPSSFSSPTPTMARLASASDACSPTMAPGTAPATSVVLAAASASAPLHPPLHPSHQRQGRALHPNRPPRMGLCPFLLLLPPARQPSAPLAPRLLASPPRQPRL